MAGRGDIGSFDRAIAVCFKAPAWNPCWLTRSDLLSTAASGRGALGGGITAVLMPRVELRSFGSVRHAPSQVPRNEARRILLWLRCALRLTICWGPRSTRPALRRCAELFKRQGTRRDALRGGAYRPLDLGGLVSLLLLTRKCPNSEDSAGDLQSDATRRFAAWRSSLPALP